MTYRRVEPMTATERKRLSRARRKAHHDAGSDASPAAGSLRAAFAALRQPQAQVPVGEPTPPAEPCWLAEGI